MKRKEVFRSLLVLGVVLSFAWLARWLSEGVGFAGGRDVLGNMIDRPGPGLIGTSASVGLFLIGSWVVSRLAKPIGIPAVTSYLLFGVAVGPGLLGLVKVDELASMDLINGLAISLIALTAGGEIEFDFVKSSIKKIVIILAIQMTAVGVGCAVFAFGLLQWMGVDGLEGTGKLIAASSILGTIAITNSPSVLLAVLAETRAKGVLSQISLAVTVCKDLVLIVLFAVVMTVAGGVLLAGDEGGGYDKNLGMYLLIHLGGSLVAGMLVGAMMAIYTVRLGAALPIFLVFVSLGIALLGDALDLEPLIVALVAGMVMANLKRIRSEHFFETVEELSLPVYCVFFAVAGASLKLDIIASIAGWAAVFVLVRFVIVWGSTTLGARVADVDPPAGTWLWTTLVPQAGVTLALATVARETLASAPYIDDLFALMMGLIAANQVIGPILMKVGLTRSGETGAF